MLVFLTTIFGFLNSLAPELLKKWQDSSDKKHELALLELQMKQQSEGHINKLEEIGMQGYTDIVQAALADQSKQLEGASKWVINLSASVRPVVTYIFLAAFIFFKICIFYAAMFPALPWNSISFVEAVNLVWGQDELALLGYIFGYYFGDRTLLKSRR